MEASCMACRYKIFPTFFLPDRHSINLSHLSNTSDSLPPDDPDRSLVDLETSERSPRDQGNDYGESRRKRTRHKMYCFHCNRNENHYHSYGDKWFYPFLIGFSLGLYAFWGPFRCVCCCHKRLTRLHHMHPRMIIRRARGIQAAPAGTRPDRD